MKSEGKKPSPSFQPKGSQPEAKRETASIGETEPTAGSAAAPIWLVFLFALLVYGGQLYTDKFGGGFDPLVYRAGDRLADVKDRQPKSEGDELFQKGQKLYGTYCVVCHQASGLGTPGQFPPLAGSEWALAPGPNRIIRIVLDSVAGPIEVKGQKVFSATMIPWRATIPNDQDIAAVLTFVRQNKEWGNGASAVTPEQVKKIRAATADHTAPWSADELLKIPDKD